MAKKSKQLAAIEKSEAQKTKIRLELHKVIRNFNKKGEQLLHQATNKDAKIITLKKKGMDENSELIKKLISESESLKKAAQDEIPGVTELMKQYTSKIETDYQNTKNAYDSLVEKSNANPVEVKKMAAKLEEAEYKLVLAEKLIDQAERGILPRKVQTTIQRIWMNRLLYLIMLPSFIVTCLFAYLPMFGITLAFKKSFSPREGILKSPWADNNGFGNFIRAFGDPDVLIAVKNTLIISLLKIICMTIFVIILALLMNEIKNRAFRRSIQSLINLPHFLSWVIMVGFIYSILSMTSGVVNKFIIQVLKSSEVNFLADPKTFRFLLVITEMWKEAGWGSIIYLAAITGIAPGLYESAIIDGANRFKQAIFITLPCIKGTIFLILIMSAGTLLNGGFDQIFNMKSPAVASVAEIIDTYVYKIGIDGGEYQMGTAVGLSKSLISLALVLSADRIAKLFGEEGIL